MARGFSSSSNDYLVTANALSPYTLRSFAGWVNVTAYGAADGRLWEWRDTPGSNGNVQLFAPAGSNVFEFTANWLTTAGTWTCPAPSSGGWHHISVSYDGGSTANDPVMYVDGVSQTVTETSTPAGASLRTNTVGMTIGQRFAGSGNKYNGLAAELGWWNILLDAGIHAALAKGYAPSFFRRGLVAYYPLIGQYSPELDGSMGSLAGSATVTGTTIADHPRRLTADGVFSPTQDSTPPPNGPPFTMRQSTLRGGDVLRGVADPALSAPVNQAVETDLAQAITVNPRRRLVGLASETDSAQALRSVKVRGIGQASEADSAQAFASRKRRVINLATEADAAQPLATLKIRAIGQATETDAAQALTSRKARQIGQASETDLAQALTVNPRRRLVGQASETDSAQALTVSPRRRLVGLASETDSVAALTSQKARPIGQTSEADLAQPITRQGGVTIALQQVVETDLAQAITHNPLRRLVGLVSETGSAQALRSVKVRGIGQASDADSAQPLAARKLRVINLATEADAATVVTPLKVRGLALIEEIDLAQPVARHKHLAIGLVTESDLAQSVQFLSSLVGYIRVTNLSASMSYAAGVVGALPTAQAVRAVGLPTLEAVSGALATVGSLDGRLPMADDVRGVL